MRKRRHLWTKCRRFGWRRTETSASLRYVPTFPLTGRSRRMTMSALTDIMPTFSTAKTSDSLPLRRSRLHRAGLGAFFRPGQLRRPGHRRRPPPEPRGGRSRGARRPRPLPPAPTPSPRSTTASRPVCARVPRCDRLPALGAPRPRDRHPGSARGLDGHRPQGARARAFAGIRLRLVRFSGAVLDLRRRATSTFEGVPVRITTPARTVVDCFRYRNDSSGVDVAIEALRDALRHAAGHDRAARFAHAEVCARAGSCRIWTRCRMSPRRSAASVVARLLNQAKATRRRVRAPPRRAMLRAIPLSPRRTPKPASASCSRARCSSASGGRALPRHARPRLPGYGSTARREPSAPSSRRSAPWPCPDDGLELRPRRSSDSSRSAPRTSTQGQRVRSARRRWARRASALQIDIGFGDAVAPGPEDADVSDAARHPAARRAPRLSARGRRRREVRGDGRPRRRATAGCKDFYDLWPLLEPRSRSTGPTSARGDRRDLRAAATPRRPPRAPIGLRAGVYARHRRDRAGASYTRAGAAAHVPPASRSSRVGERMRTLPRTGAGQHVAGELVRDWRLAAGRAMASEHAALQAVPGLQGLRRRVAGGDSGALGGYAGLRTYEVALGTDARCETGDR